MVPGGPELVVPDPTDSGYLRQSFSSLAVPVFPGAARRRISLARGADDRGSPAGPALAQVVESKVVGIAGRVGVGPIRQGNALRGWGQRPLRWTGPTALQSPLCGKGGGAHIHTHTPAHRERAALTSTCHSRHALSSGALSCGVVLCVGM